MELTLAMSPRLLWNLWTSGCRAKGGTLELSVLAVMAVGLLLVATWLLSRAIIH